MTCSRCHSLLRNGLPLAFLLQSDFCVRPPSWLFPRAVGVSTVGFVDYSSAARPNPFLLALAIRFEGTVRRHDCLSPLQCLYSDLICLTRWCLSPSTIGHHSLAVTAASDRVKRRFLRHCKVEKRDVPPLTDYISFMQHNIASRRPQVEPPSLAFEAPACTEPSPASSSTGGTRNISARPAVPPAVAITNPDLLSFVEDTGAVDRIAATDLPNCFTLYDAVRQTRIVRSNQPKDVATCIGIAMGHFRSPPTLRVLRTDVAGLPSPQFAATPSDVSALTRTWPLDARALGLGICVVDGPVESTPFSLAYKAKDVCRFSHLHHGLARGSLLATASGFVLAPYDALPLAVDSFELSLAGGSSRPEGSADSTTHSGSAGSTVSSMAMSIVQDLRDLELSTFAHDADYCIMLHVPGRPPYCMDANRHQDTQSLAASASRLLCGVVSHSVLQIHWPGLTPLGADCLVHALVELDHSPRGDRTIALFDGRALCPCGPGLVSRIIPAVVTLGELFCLARETFPDAYYPSQIRINGRIMLSQDLCRLYCPLLRVVTVAGAGRDLRDRYASALPTQELLDMLPGLAIDLQIAQTATLSSSLVSLDTQAETLEYPDEEDMPVSLLQFGCVTVSRASLGVKLAHAGQVLDCVNADDWSLGPECGLNVCVRSFLLLQLLAFLRLIVFATLCRSNQERRNRVVRGSRCFLRGAPVCLCLALCCVVATGAPTGAADGGPFTDQLGIELVNEALARTAAPHRNVHSDSTSDHCHDADGPDLRVPEPPPAVPGIGAPSPVSGTDSTNESDNTWFFPVRVLQLQREALQISMVAAVSRDAADAVARAEAVLDARARHCRFVAVEPQPSADYLVLLVEHVAAEHMFLIPVCIQLQAGADMIRIWMEYVDPDITFDGLRMLLGQDWPAGARVFVGTSRHPLSEYTSARLVSGTLIRVLAPGRPLRPLVSTDDKLRFLDRHLGDVAVSGYPLDDFRPHRYGLLQPLHEARTVDFSPVGGMASLDSVVNSHADKGFGSTTLSWPVRQPARHYVRGQPVDRTAAAFPVSCTARCPLFVDGHHIGTPLQVYAAQTGWLLLPDLLHSIGLVVPWPEKLRVSGTVRTSPDGKAVLVRPSELLVLQYLGSDEATAATCAICLDSSDDERGGDDADPDSPCCAAGRTPNHTTSRPSEPGYLPGRRPRSRSPVPHSAACTDTCRTSLARKMSDEVGDTNICPACDAISPSCHHLDVLDSKRSRCFRRDAHPLRHTGDASASLFLWNGEPRQDIRPVFSYHMALEMLNSAPVVICSRVKRLRHSLRLLLLFCPLLSPRCQLKMRMRTTPGVFWCLSWLFRDRASSAHCGSPHRSRWTTSLYEPTF